jgi:flavin reductase (DIM6/NTAB) family NADH-FMN oxidoreductase RutF
MMMEFLPPLLCGMLGPWDYTYKALRTTRECVLAIPTVDLAAKVVDIGNCSGRDVDKFQQFGLTALPAKKVKAPLIAECLANLECRVMDTRMVNRYGMFVLEVVKGWIDSNRTERRTFHANGDGTFVVDGRTIDLKKKMIKWKEYL